MLRTSSSTDSSTSAAQIIAKYDGVDGGGNGGKSVEKSSKVWKICKGHRFGRTFTEAPILRRFNYPSGCWARELSQYHFRIDYRQKLMELLMLCHVFLQRSQSKEEDLQAENTQILAVFANQTPVFLAFLALLWAPIAPSSYLQNARPPFATSVLEIRSGRKRPSPEIKAEMLDGWENVEEILHHQEHFGIEKT